MESLVLYLVRGLVRHPEAVQVRTGSAGESAADGQAVVLEVSLAPEDVGRVIGRQGRTIRAIRKLLSAAGQLQNRRYLLELLE